MTRILSELLQTDGPRFGLQLKQLERLQGHNNTDIKLSVEVVQTAKQKIRQLGLDQHDTTSHELYQALMSRITADDKRLERSLRTLAATHVSAEADLTAGIIKALQSEAENVTVTAIKPSVLKRQLRQHPPKRLQKALGYRSLDAMLRREPVVMMVVMAGLIESQAWIKGWRDEYKKMSAADFENRHLSIVSPGTDRWRDLNAKLLADRSNTVASAPELGVLVILPVPSDHPDGMVVATTALALHEVNSIMAISNYLRASQVHGHFGDRVKRAADGAITIDQGSLPHSLPWQLVQRYFATSRSAADENVFGPYIQASDFGWHDVQQKLAALCPSLSFWADSAHVTYLTAGQRVSFNIVDSAINCCNRLSYEARSVYHAEQALWSELLLRYIDHSQLERVVAAELQPALAAEMAVR